jgi:hypothetical protein
MMQARPSTDCSTNIVMVSILSGVATGTGLRQRKQRCFVVSHTWTQMSKSNSKQVATNVDMIAFACYLYSYIVFHF